MTPPDFGIIFLHYNINSVVKNNLASIQRQNPNALIETLSAGQAFPDGYSIDKTPELKFLHSIKPKKSSDWLLCSWFLQRKQTCRKWWIVEWDVYSTVPTQEYYKPVWGYPFVVSGVRYPHRESEYGWFKFASHLPGIYKRYVMGGAPFIYLVDDNVLSAVCEALIRKPTLVGNAELRFCTIANSCGYPPCGFSPPGDYIGWQRWKRIPRRHRTIFHPVKHFVRS